MSFRNFKQQIVAAEKYQRAIIRTIKLSGGATILGMVDFAAATRENYLLMGGFSLASMLVTSPTFFYYAQLNSLRLAHLHKSQKLRRAVIAGPALVGLFLWAAHGLVRSKVETTPARSLAFVAPNEHQNMKPRY